jgi:hypothetical protein
MGMNDGAYARPFRHLTTALALLMLAQSLLGLVLPDQYRDAEWIRATWYRNDWVTLVAAVSLLGLGEIRTARGSVRSLLLSLGIVGYAVYNSAFYLFGAALNAFFPLYVIVLVLGIVALGLALSQVDADAVARSFRRDTPVRLIGGYLVFVAVGLAIVWLAMWGAYVFAGRPLPIEPEAFKVVAALDLSLMVPALALGGAQLWTRRAWGFVVAAIAAIQGALYLFVLSVNSTIVIQRGLVPAPGELPVWGTLAVLTTAAALLILKNAPSEGAAF